MSHQTGPRTEEGKQASSQNNRQHGLSTANIIVSPEERPFFDQMEAELRDEIVPAGPLENFAFQRLITANWQLERCRQKEAALRALESTEQNEANLDKVHRYYQRWEGSYKSALREIRILQTDRAIQAYSNGQRPESFSPLADVPKIEQFARRMAKPFTSDDQVRHALSTQQAILTLEKQIKDLGSVPVTGHAYLKAPKAAASAQTKSTTCETKSGQNPERERRVTDTSAKPTASTTCETKSAPKPEVGRNSPCPCGSGQKYKRCCGVNAPPIYNQAA